MAGAVADGAEPRHVEDMLWRVSSVVVRVNWSGRPAVLAVRRPHDLAAPHCQSNRCGGGILDRASAVVAVTLLPFAVQFRNALAVALGIGSLIEPMLFASGLSI